MIYRKNLRKHGLATDNNVFLVAEIGLNHGGDIGAAKRLIDSASKTGVDAVKFQTYITEKRVPKNSPIFSILKKCELPLPAFEKLQKHAQSHGLEFFSTPFDDESVDYLENINCSMYKIASFDVVNHKFLKKVAGTKKTILMSVGISTPAEIEAAFKILKSRTDNIVIMHCVSAYPTKEEDSNISAIYTLREKFDCIIGQSDHTDGIYVPLCAIAAGAQVIEKHYKIDEKMKCVDAPVSITEKQMKEMIKKTRRIEKIIGDNRLGPCDSEIASKIFRRHSS